MYWEEKMQVDSFDVLNYIEPVYRFCFNRMQCRQDAEDLSQEIILHILHGVDKGNIKNLNAWVWRIAHNRYARLINSKKRNRQELLDDFSTIDECSDYDNIDRLILEEEHKSVFDALHTLSAMYRNILVDYYIHGLSMIEIANSYGISLNTVKWRLHAGKAQMKERMKDKMNKVYERINWNTDTCNGNMDSDRYLHTQIARAICNTAYEKPLTVSEISIATGVPAVFLEDELERLIYGDAIVQKGIKYQTNFIILRRQDNERLLKTFLPYVETIADIVEEAIGRNTENIRSLGFHGCDFGTARLGYIITPLILRKAISNIQNSSEKLRIGPFPPRKDGGYGWFIVSESESGKMGEYSSGNNQFSDGNDHGRGLFVYLWLGKYFSNSLYRQGLNWLFDKNVMKQAAGGLIPDDVLSEEEIAKLISLGLVEKFNESFRFSIPIFNREQLKRFEELFAPVTDNLVSFLDGLVLKVWEEFCRFVPENVHNQINQYVAGYIHKVISLVTEELLKRKVLADPPDDKPLSYGVFYVNDWPGWQI